MKHGKQRLFEVRPNDCNLDAVSRHLEAHPDLLGPFRAHIGDPAADLTPGNLERACAVLESLSDFTWQKLGDLFVPVLEVRSVQLCDPAPDAKTVQEGLALALRHAQNPAEWIDSQARSGPAAFAYWAEALETGEAKRDHHTYNAQLWLECREMGVAFLREATTYLSGRCGNLLDEAATCYEVVCERLKILIELHPSREEPDWGPDSTFSSVEAAAIVRQAGEADAEGLTYLEQIVGAL